jgi:Tn3 transposase DDE domain/Domain of unknown function (DUF4158)
MIKQNWDTEELIENWTLLPQELELAKKKVGGNQIAFTLLLKHFQLFAYFPEDKSSISQVVVSYIASQVNIPESSYSDYDWQGRSAKVYRVEIRRLFNFKVASVQDSEEMVTWLIDEILPDEQKNEAITELVYQRFRELKLEPPTKLQVERLIKSALAKYEANFEEQILDKLTPEMGEQIDVLLSTEETEDLENDERLKPTKVKLKMSDFAFLKTDPGTVGLDSFLTEIEKLERILAIGLPTNLFEGKSSKLVKTYRHRAATETPYLLRQHKDSIRYTLMAAFCIQRSQEITDSLIEILTTIVKRIDNRAEKRINQQLIEEFKKVSGKTGLLYRIAEVSIAEPNGVIEQVIFPVVSLKTLKDLVAEYKGTGLAYKRRVHNVMRASFAGHYRRMIPQLLELLEFRSNNDLHRPVIEALELLKKYAQSKARYYDSSEEIPIDGVLKAGAKEILIETDSDGNERINRINYEICVLKALRERLCCKEIWVIGANRYRNPDDDLPTDFEVKRQIYYQTLTLPEDVETFISSLQQQMEEGLEKLDKGMPKNKGVAIGGKGNKGLIRLSPFDAASDPINLRQLKGEINRLWHKTSLLDILKETDLRVDFTRKFKSMGTREILDRETLQKRLLLCLFGMGTNTGLKRINTGIDGENYQDLIYVRRRYIHKDQLRSAIAEIVNATFEIRLPHIWGEGTTTCASDSKHFPAWQQNLMTQYHLRYGGRGVMIYWHVEKNSTCIHSQLKTCSSSSVLSLHLLQICLVYVNTLMIQSVLAQEHWQKRLTARDLQAITPLIFSHVNPYGLFRLDMKERISRLWQPLVA